MSYVCMYVCLSTICVWTFGLILSTLEHTFPLIFWSKDFLGRATGSGICTSATINWLWFAV